MSGGFKLQCITIATFSSFIVSCDYVSPRLSPVWWCFHLTRDVHLCGVITTLIIIIIAQQQQQQQPPRGRDYRHVERQARARVCESVCDSVLSGAYHDHALPRRHSTPLDTSTPPKARPPTYRPPAPVHRSQSTTSETPWRASPRLLGVSSGIPALFSNFLPITDTDSVLCVHEDCVVLHRAY